MIFPEKNRLSSHRISRDKIMSKARRVCHLRLSGSGDGAFALIRRRERRRRQRNGMKIEIDRLDLRYERLRRRDPRREKRILASLAELKQLFPILVMESDGTVVVIDGYRGRRRRQIQETVRQADGETGAKDDSISGTG
jgi:hypothetical protein